jgi:hypothetical protein
VRFLTIAVCDWVFASPAARGQRPYWGQSLMRTVIRPVAAKVGITAYRLAHLPTHVFFTVKSKQDRDQSNARIAPSRVQRGHFGHLYPGSDSTKATSPEQCRSSSARIHNSRLRPLRRRVFLFCAYSNRRDQCGNFGCSLKCILCRLRNCAYVVPAKEEWQRVSC